ncbi:hypothetical protein [Flavilitoribacter nigricans]|nr:hypothetical protein [Flavilitoribacter nigricans]
MQPARAQAQVEIVDLEANVTAWSDGLAMDIMFLEQEQVFMGMMERWLERLQKKYNAYQKTQERNYMPDGRDDALKHSVMADQQGLLAAETYYLDTINVYKQEMLAAIQASIRERVDHLNHSSEDRMIVFQQAILYQEENHPTRALMIPIEPADRESLQSRLDALELEMIIAYTRYFGLMEEIGQLDLGRFPLKE